MSSRFNAALASGLAGASALTVIHEIGRRVLPDAPRMDVLGMRAIARGMMSLGGDPPPADELRQQALIGDIAANSLYYAAVRADSPSATWARGVLLGALAGVGALVLPERIGLGTPPNSESRRNQFLTVTWYIVGGVAAAAVANAMRPAASRAKSPQ